MVSPAKRAHVETNNVCTRSVSDPVLRRGRDRAGSDQPARAESYAGLYKRIGHWAAIPAGSMPYRIRQAPGAKNALGQVKIMFPNIHNVYLHDTPDRGLFAQRQRAFSSGCIRTQDPIDLAEWLLSDTLGWDRTRIDTTLLTNRETRVNLTSKVPVHVLYLTAVSDAAGVRFVDDVYDRDAAVLSGLTKRASAR